MMEVQFSNWAPYATARANWTDAGLPFLLVTTAGTADGHFVYYLTEWVECVDATLACNLGVEPSELEHVGDEFTLDFGQYSDLEKRDDVVPPPAVPTAPPIPADTPDVPSEPPSPISSFDIALDEAAGFYQWSPESFAEDLDGFADNITDVNYDHYNSNASDVGGVYDVNGSTAGDFILEVAEEDFNIMKIRKRLAVIKRQNIKRGLFSVLGGKLVAIGQIIVDSVKKAVQDTGDKIAAAFKGVKDQVFAVIDSVKSWVDGTPRTWQSDNNYNFPKPDDKRYVYQDKFTRAGGTRMDAIQLYPPDKNSNGPVKVYCLDCKAAAGIIIKGTIGYKWGEGLKHGLGRYPWQFRSKRTSWCNG